MASALIAPPFAVARAFSPGHITGLFDPQKQHRLGNDKLLMGSRGAGFSIDRGIDTTVLVSEATKPGYTISINGQTTGHAEVSKWVAEHYLAMSGRSYFLEINHSVDIPIGYGLGSSGAAALSLSIALNNALGFGLSPTRAAQIAHIAEIECRTGLGTVIAEFEGGFEIRTKAGAPGIGKVAVHPLDGYRAIILCLAPVSTKQFLAKKQDSLNGHRADGNLLDYLVQSKSPEDFVRMSFELASYLGLADGRCKAPLHILFSKGYLGSVALFGETVFTLVPEEDADLVAGILRPFGGTLLTCNIDTIGARAL
jgi:pantoate kinase